MRDGVFLINEKKVRISYLLSFLFSRNGFACTSVAQGQVRGTYRVEGCRRSVWFPIWVIVPGEFCAGQLSALFRSEPGHGYDLKVDFCEGCAGIVLRFWSDNLESRFLCGRNDE